MNKMMQCLVNTCINSEKISQNSNSSSRSITFRAGSLCFLLQENCNHLFFLYVWHEENAQRWLQGQFPPCKPHGRQFQDIPARQVAIINCSYLCLSTKKKKYIKTVIVCHKVCMNSVCKIHTENLHWLEQECGDREWWKKTQTSWFYPHSLAIFYSRNIIHHLNRSQIDFKSIWICILMF